MVFLVEIMGYWKCCRVTSVFRQRDRQIDPNRRWEFMEQY